MLYAQYRSADVTQRVSFTHKRGISGCGLVGWTDPSEGTITCQQNAGDILELIAIPERWLSLKSLDEYPEVGTKAWVQSIDNDRKKITVIFLRPKAGRIQLDFIISKM